MRTIPIAMKRVLLRLTLAFGSIVLTIGVLEASLRSFTSLGSTLMRRDPKVGQHYVANFTGDVHVPESNRSVRLRFNSLGFRGADVTKEKPAGVRRVAVIGDSFVAAIAVDEKDTMTSRLAGELKDQLGGQWELMNFGVSGLSTAQELLVWRHYVRQFQPDVVLLCFFNGNDLADNHPKLNRRYFPRFSIGANGQLAFEPVDAKRVSLSAWLEENSRLYAWNRDLAMRIRRRFHTVSGQLDPNLQVLNSSPPPPYLQAWKITEQLIAALVRETEADGVRTVVVGLPAHEQILDRNWQSLMDTVPPGQHGTWDRDYPERRLRAICENVDVAYVPLLEDFRVQYGPTTQYYLPEGHWNESANAFAATVVARELATKLADLAVGSERRVTK